MVNNEGRLHVVALGKRYLADKRRRSHRLRASAINADEVAHHQVPFALGAIGAINGNGIGKRLMLSGSMIKVRGGADRHRSTGK